MDNFRNLWNHKVNVTTNRLYFTLRRIDISPSALRKHTRLAGEERVFKEENQKVCFEWTFFFSHVNFSLVNDIVLISIVCLGRMFMDIICNL